ncbi:MAG: rod shape-determining protein RodA [Acidobacteria bacterium]|nr:rod shape-determining protein RodA [Acidobacteriota bacterium]
MFDRRFYRHLDWPLVAAVYALCVIGVLMIYSTTGDAARAAMARLFLVQIYAILIGTVALVICLSVDYRSLADRAQVIYAILLGFLVYVLIFGVVRGGGRRWIPLPLFNLQPSEFAKIVVALLLARLFAANQKRIPSTGNLVVGGVMTAVPLLLIWAQPDFGTPVTLVSVLLGIAYVAGMRLRVAGVLLALAIVTAPIVWNYALKDYQKARVVTFLDPWRDPRGKGYQQIQAQITVGAGGLWGQGFRKGTQGQLSFLPARHNDFIFSVLAEEHGFVGVLAVLGLYLFIVVRSIETARLANDRLGTYLVVGVLSSFTFQVLYNISMSAGLAPVKGLTLPLMSYGGSSLIATLAGFGLILNVRMRRFTNS